jgi:hypothetical protein
MAAWRVRAALITTKSMDYRFPSMRSHRSQRELDGKTLREARRDASTGDVVFFFEPNVELQVFDFIGYEDWEIHFSNGTGEYSNYAR